MVRLKLTHLFGALALVAGFGMGTAMANTTPQTLPFTQNWSTPITGPNNNWSSVPGIVGFLGDDPATTAAPQDPTLRIADNTTTNLTTNSLVTAGSGGVHYVPTAQTIALQGSGSADYPNIVINLDLSHNQDVVVNYNLRQLDNDAATQPILLQFRIGNTGNFTNVLTSLVSDASTSPTVSIPQSIALPSDVNGQSLVQIRILTGNAAGNDNLIGIDDINITGSALSDNPNISVPLAVSFGSVFSTTSKTQSIVISNTGSSNALNIQNTSAITGTGAGKFSILTPLPLSIPAGTTASLQVRFTPAGTPGSYTASLNLNSNDPSDGAVSVALTATATDDPNLSVASSLNLGNVVSSSNKTVNLSVTNAGSAGSLNITGSAISGTNAAAFSVTSGVPQTLAPGASGTISVRVAPGGAVGALSGVLGLQSNDQTSATVNIGLTAFSSAPLAVGYDYLNPSGIIFTTNSVLMSGIGAASGTFMISSITFDNDGKILAFVDETSSAGSSSSDGGAGALVRISQDGTSVTVVATEAALTAGLSPAQTDLDVNNLSVDAAGNIYISEFQTSNKVLKLTRPGLVTSVLWTGGGIVGHVIDRANSQLIVARALSLGAAANEVSAVSLPGGTESTLLSTADFNALLGTTASSIGLGTALIDPTNPANLIVYSEAGFGGVDRVVRINNYMNSATRTATTLFDASAFISAPGFTPMVASGDGTLWAYERNAVNTPAGQSNRLSIMSPAGVVYSTTSDDLDILFGYTGANTDDTMRDVFPRNNGQLAARVEGSTLALYIASAGGPRHLFKLVIPEVVTVNSARTWELLD